MAGPLWVLAIFSLMIGLAFPVFLASAAFFGALALIVTVLQMLGVIGKPAGTRACPHCTAPIGRDTETCPNCGCQTDA